MYDAFGRLTYKNYLNGAGEHDQQIVQRVLKTRPFFHWDQDKDDLGGKCFVLSMRMHDIKDLSNGAYGRLEIPYSELETLFSELRGEQMNLRIVGKEETPDAETASNRYLYRMPLEGTPWQVVITYTKPNVYQKNAYVFSNLFYLLCAVACAILLIAYVLVHALLGPLGRIGKRMREYEFDGIDPELLKGNCIDEIDTLGVCFNQMIERTEELLDNLLLANKENNSLQQGLKIAELTALQAQIDPHFLYNTLNVLIYLIDSEQKHKAHSMVLSLITFFRNGVSQSEWMIPFEQEISSMRAYTELFAIRFEDQMHFIWTLDPASLSLKIPKLILQPLIENAVVHAHAKTVLITSALRQGELILTVADDGTGINGEELQAIRRRLQDTQPQDSLGIYNVQRRIQLLYGREYGLAIQSAEGRGTTVTITLSSGATLDQ